MSAFRLLRAAVVVWSAWSLASAALAAQIVEGHIVNAATGAGIAGVRVRLLPAGDTRGGLSETGNVYSATTDPQGHFRIEGVKDGAYTPRYVAQGFFSIPNGGATLPPFPVATGGEPVRLEVKMQPLGKLSGRVLDATGKPVPNASLWLVGEARWCMPPACSPRTMVAKTNEKGEYSATGLAPGPWLLSAAAPSDWKPPESIDDQRRAWAQTFFPGETDPQLAEAVIVAPASELWNLDIKLAAVPAHGLRGRVVDVSGNPVSKASVALGKGFGPSLTQETRSDGTFEFAAVADADWRLSAALDRGGVRLRGAQSVEVKDHDPANVELRLTAPFTLRGKVVMEVPDGVPAPQPPAVDLMLFSGTALLSDGADTSLPAPWDEGNLTVRDVYPGLYQVVALTGSLAPYYLDAIRLGDQDANGSVSILSDAQPLTIKFKLGGGTVRGTVENCGAAHVLLIPQDPALRRPPFVRVTTCGPNGRFEFPAVRPGEYYGFADAGEPSAATLQDGAVLKQASRVSVNANESISADIRLIAR